MCGLLIDFHCNDSYSCFSFFFVSVFVCFVQTEDPAIHWQIALYRNLPYHLKSSDPEKTVGRVLHIANVLFHLDQVCESCATYLDD